MVSFEQLSVPRCKIYCLDGDRKASKQAFRVTLDSNLNVDNIDFENIVELLVVLSRRWYTIKSLWN